MFKHCKNILFLLLITISSVTAAEKELPKVLILGDSISIGYTVPVRNLLKGKAEVIRPKANCGPSERGVANIKKWLGDGKWDVIHFNFGIWDTHFINKGKIVPRGKVSSTPDAKRRNSTEQYIKNLKTIIEALKKTQAKLVFATTTPWISYGEDTLELIKTNNQAAVELMKAEGIAINDLNTLATANLKQWQKKDGCHYTLEGSKGLAKQVAEVIGKTLEEEK